jgi:hypothetical protein
MVSKGAKAKGDGAAPEVKKAAKKKAAVPKSVVAPADANAAKAAKAAALKGGKTPACVPMFDASSTVLLAPYTAAKENEPLSGLESIAVGRALKRKLGQLLLQENLDHYLDTDGQKLKDVVGYEFRRTRLVGTYISNEFWDKVVVNFNLVRKDWSELPVVPNVNLDDEFIDASIGDMVVKAFGANPALKANGVGLLEQRLIGGGRVALWQLRKLLVLSADEKEITHKNAQRLQHAILRHMSEHDLVDKYKEGWMQLKRQMEMVAVSHWEKVNESLGRAAYVRAFRKVLLNFVDAEALDAVEAALRDGKIVPIAMLNKLLSTVIGSYIYSDNAKDIQWNAFLVSIADGIKNLMHLNFDNDEVLNSSAKMRRETQALVFEGVDALEKAEVIVNWFGFQMPIPVTHVDNFWEAPLYAAKVCCAINAGVLNPFTPWEKLLLVNGKIPNYPEACRVPEAVIESIATVRSRLMHHIGDQKSFEEWKITMSKHAENLKTITQWLTIDEVFLNSYSRQALLVTLQQKVLDEITTPVAAPEADVSIESVKQGLASALEAMKMLKVGSLAVAVGVRGTDAFEWVSTFIQNVVGYTAPSAKTQSSFTAWRAQVVNAVETVVQGRFDRKDKSEKLVGLMETELIRGKEADVRLFNQFAVAEEDPNPRDMLRRVEPFRMFHWCLSDDEQKVKDRIVSSAISKIKIGCTSELAIADLELPPAGTKWSVALALLGAKIGGAASVAMASSSGSKSSSSSACLTINPKPVDANTKRKNDLLDMFSNR